MQAVREPAQVVERARDLARADLELLADRVVVALEPLREVQPLADRDEPLLRAVVEVALEPASDGRWIAVTRTTCSGWPILQPPDSSASSASLRPRRG